MLHRGLRLVIFEDQHDTHRPRLLLVPWLSDQLRELQALAYTCVTDVTACSIRLPVFRGPFFVPITWTGKAPQSAQNTQSFFFLLD